MLRKKFYIIFQPDGATLNLLPADTDLGFYYRKCTTLEAWPLCHCQQSTARTPTAGTSHARVKILSVALLRQANKSEYGTAHPSSKRLVELVDSQ